MEEAEATLEAATRLVSDWLYDWSGGDARERRQVFSLQVRDGKNRHELLSVAEIFNAFQESRSDTSRVQWESAAEALAPLISARLERLLLDEETAEAQGLKKRGRL